MKLPVHSGINARGVQQKCLIECGLFEGKVGWRRQPPPAGTACWISGSFGRHRHGLRLEVEVSPVYSEGSPRVRLLSILPSASFDALGIIWCTFLAPFFSCFPASHAPFDNRNGLRDVLLFLGELRAIVLRVQTGGAPDARKRGVEPSLPGPVRGCIIWCTTGYHLMPLCGSIDTS